MNSDQAKKLSLPEILSRLGHEPVKITKNGNEYWYLSPFRKEKEASFHTSFLGGKWIWKDFGDIGGTVIDFVMRHQNYTSVGEVLRHLSEMFEGPLFNKTYYKRVGEAKIAAPDLFSFQQQAAPQALENFENRELELISAHAIANPIIYSYLAERGISSKLADRYLKEVKYKNLKTNKEYFAFGMENESGGYEIRVASSQYHFKSALKARDITLISGSSSDASKVNVVEGMVDFLSLCAMYNTLQLTSDTIILHSLTSYSHAFEKIKERGYKTINTFLDNNTPGRKYTEKFKQEFAGKVQDQSSLFLPHTDLNDAWLANQPQLVVKQ